MSAKKSGSKAKGAPTDIFHTRDVVLGKLRGFPPWPGIIVDPDSIPKAVAKDRPRNKSSNVYAVRFIPAGDYKKPGKLIEGYRKALDPVAWEKEHAVDPPATKRKSKSKIKKFEDGEEEDLAAHDEDEKAGEKRKTGQLQKQGHVQGRQNARKERQEGRKPKSLVAVKTEDEKAEEAEGDGEQGAEEGEARASKKPKVADASALESDPEPLKAGESAGIESNRSGSQYPTPSDVPALEPSQPPAPILRNGKDSSIVALTQEYWNTLQAMRQLRALGTTLDHDKWTTSDLDLSEQIRQLELKVEQELIKLKMAEAILKDVLRECETPVVVPELLELVRLWDECDSASSSD
ncbi:hypothetical protein B0H14DRAFT_2700698 [Mycena olivaceomarginata]|nr:hypothetical protein B0H14DRAFT_2700698 [Mycena olivaceomarginata]